MKWKNIYKARMVRRQMNKQLEKRIKNCDKKKT